MKVKPEGKVARFFLHQPYRSGVARLLLTMKLYDMMISLLTRLRSGLRIDLRLNRVGVGVRVRGR